MGEGSDVLKWANTYAEYVLLRLVGMGLGMRNLCALGLLGEPAMTALLLAGACCESDISGERDHIQSLRVRIFITNLWTEKHFQIRYIIIYTVNKTV